MRVSVIIPTFNRANVLGEAVASVLDQSFRDFELVVVDDGSTDGTADLLAAVAAGDPRVRSMVVPHRGAAAARNAGIRASTGELIAFLDSDDRWEPWHLELAVATLERRPEVGLTWADLVLVEPDGSPIAASSIRTLLPAFRFVDWAGTFPESLAVEALWSGAPASLRGHLVHIGDIYSQLIMGNIVLASSAVIRRSVADRVGGFEERWQVGEDYDYFLRASRDVRVAFLDVSTVRYRVGRADKLARPENALAMAEAYLAVLDRTLATDRGRVRLPPAMVTTAVAHAHRWIGELELAAGDHPRARAALLTSWRTRAGQPSIAPLIGLTLLPRPLVQRTLRWRRALLGRSPTAHST